MREVENCPKHMIAGQLLIMITVPRTSWLLWNLLKLVSQSRQLMYVDQLLFVRHCASGFIYLGQNVHLDFPIRCYRKTQRTFWPTQYDDAPPIVQGVGIQYFVVCIKTLRLGMSQVTQLSDKVRLATQFFVLPKQSWSLQVSSTHITLIYLTYSLANLQYSFLLGLDKVTNLTTQDPRLLVIDGNWHMR